jgi:hypothetical protein
MKLKGVFLRLLIMGAAGCYTLSACNQQKRPEVSNKITVTPPVAATPQDASTLSLDKSPMDMSYYPVDFTKQKMLHNVNEPLVARVIYSRPKKDKRVIFGDVLKFGAPWRLGANEATELEFFRNVRINNQQVEKGRYVIYCIPFQNEWTIILNNDLYTWGLKIDSTKDVYRFNVPAKITPEPFERFTMEFQKAEKGMELNIAWDTLYASLPILY